MQPGLKEATWVRPEESRQALGGKRYPSKGGIMGTKVADRQGARGAGQACKGRQVGNV